MRGTERTVKYVPAPLLCMLMLAALAQLVWHAHRAAPEATAASLPAPPEQTMLEIMAGGDRIALSKALMLWLQAFDNQPGISIPFRDLDYGRVIAWLTQILRLDERAAYPLLAAARLYGEVPVPDKQRQMLDFIQQEFVKDPDRRWPWMAHAVYIAKHRLNDLPLALRYADMLALHAKGEAVPSWAKQMAIFVREDMGEIEAAKILLGGLLESGEIKDPAEQRFLMRRLKELEERHQR